jgi:hypothetical protein
MAGVRAMIPVWRSEPLDAALTSSDDGHSVLDDARDERAFDHTPPADWYLAFSLDQVAELLLTEDEASPDLVVGDGVAAGGVGCSEPPWVVPPHHPSLDQEEERHGR